MDEIVFRKTLEIYESQLKQRIINFLDIYQELSLTELSQKLGKSKSTVSKHLNELLKIKVNNKQFINVREQKHRGSINQKIYSRNIASFFFGKTHDEIKEYTPKQMLELLQNEEFLINIRLFSLLKDVISQTYDFVHDFYTNISLKDITEDFKENIYRYNTCIPRISYFTTEEYIEYREKFLEFDDMMLKKIEKKRSQTPNATKMPREYLVTHTMLPIKRILDREFY